jgi:hypothetical protein
MNGSISFPGWSPWEIWSGCSNDLSFASNDWQQTVQVRRKRKDWSIRQHLETCVFTYIAAELKSGDLCVRGSEQFADYRDQLLSWAECEPKVAEYCHQLDFPTTAEGFVTSLREWLTQIAASVDHAYPENHALTISAKGEPSLCKTPAKVPPKGLKQLEEDLHMRLSERHLLDILYRVEHWTGWSRHFGPLSGSEPKMEAAKVRQILTVFAYGTNLGPHQMARHLRGEVTAEVLAHINRRHITAEKLDAANRDIINRFRRCILPRFLFGLASLKDENDPGQIVKQHHKMKPKSHPLRSQKGLARAFSMTEKAIRDMEKRRCDLCSSEDRGCEGE